MDSKPAPTQTDLLYVRLYHRLLDAMMTSKKVNSLTKNEIDIAFTNVSNIIKNGINRMPELREPQVEEVTPDACKCLASEPKNSYYINKAYNIVFTKYKGTDEYIAYGEVIDKDLESEILVKLNMDSVIQCINNGWRFDAKRCTSNINVFNSGYALHND